MASLDRRRIAGLDCYLIQPDRPPNKIAIFCHGFGAPGDDLVPVGAELANEHPQILENYLLVFPAAPISLADQGMPGGRAWWPLDMMRLQQAIQSGQIRDLSKDAPAELPKARSLLNGLIDELLESTGLAISDLVLGGFSQGSMLAIDIALHLEKKPGGLIIWSGTLLNEDAWRYAAQTMSGIPIVQSHGHQDPILPYQGALLLRDLLINNGANVQFIDFQGQHSIPASAMQAAADLLLDRLK